MAARGGRLAAARARRRGAGRIVCCVAARGTTTPPTRARPTATTTNPTTSMRTSGSAWPSRPMTRRPGRQTRTSARVAYRRAGPSGAEPARPVPGHSTGGLASRRRRPNSQPARPPATGLIARHERPRGGSPPARRAGRAPSSLTSLHRHSCPLARSLAMMEFSHEMWGRSPTLSPVRRGRTSRPPAPGTGATARRPHGRRVSASLGQTPSTAGWPVMLAGRPGDRWRHTINRQLTD